MDFCVRMQVVEWETNVPTLSTVQLGTEPNNFTRQFVETESYSTEHKATFEDGFLEDTVYYLKVTCTDTAGNFCIHTSAFTVSNEFGTRPVTTLGFSPSFKTTNSKQTRLLSLTPSSSRPSFNLLGQKLNAVAFKNRYNQVWIHSKSNLHPHTHHQN